MASDSTTQLLDPIAMEVFSNRLLSVTEDMGNTLIRASFSTNIKERKDCSVALFDARGRLVAQASHIPIHLGSLQGGVDAALARYKLSDLVPGDAFICNDAYLAGGTHAPDITIVTPVFWDGRVRFFTANIGHHSDVGGSSVGSTTHNARTVFEEGLRIPITRVVRGGVVDEDLLNLIAQNTREPEDRVLDLKVQIATNEKGARLVEELIRQLGIEAVERSIDDVLAYTARRLRNRIAQMPEKSATFSTWMDDDGVGSEPVEIRATVRVADGRLHVDFAGTGPQSKGSYNVPPSALRASVIYAVKALLDPELMPNAGLFEPVSISAPEGTIVNPRFPGAVGARSNTAQKAAGALIGALSELLPEERRMASGNDIMASTLYAGPRSRRPGMFVYVETIGGGGGARSDADGQDGIHVHITNTSNLPAEALEIEYDLLVDEYALIPDSGGAGRFRGGLGIARQIRALKPGMVSHLRVDGSKVGSAGLAGGGEGGHGRVVKNHGRNSEEPVPPKSANNPMAVGDSYRLETPGGGGYGDARQRDPAALAADLRGGKVSEAAARRDYGDALVEKALRLKERGG
jgi:N-methylhydantoinase B